jgi:hypothetical protein
VGFQHAADCFNPKIKARALKLPPTKGPDENVCEWEFKLDEWLPERLGSGRTNSSRASSDL